MSNTKRDQRNYQRLAGMVLRDSVGFYFGIQEFFKNNSSLPDAVDYLVAKGKTKEEATKLVISRMKELDEDFRHCKELLSADNIWYQLLELDAEVFYKYLNTLTSEEREQLAVVPRWTTKDCALGRPYINDKFGTNERADSFN